MDELNKILRYSNKIIKVRENSEGDISDVMLENGQIVPLNLAILMTKHNTIDGYNVVRGKNGGEFLKADSNEDEVDDLDDLPRFS